MTLKARIRVSVWVLVDIFLVNLAAYMSYVLRGTLYLDLRWRDLLMDEYQNMFWQMLLVVTVVRISTFFVFKLYKPVWRYASVSEFVAILKAVTLGTAVFIVGMYFSRQVFYSRWVVAIDWVLNLILVGMTKFSSRIFYEYRVRLGSGPKTNVLIVGAESTGQNALREIRNRRKKRYSPVGFVDDNPEMQGKSILGVEVLGTSKDIPDIVRSTHADEVLVAVNAASSSKIRELSTLCEKTNAQKVIH